MPRKVVKQSGHKEAFDREKLHTSIYYPARESGYDEDAAEELAEHVCTQVADWIESHEDNVVTSYEVRDKVQDLLEQEDEDVAFMYRTHLDIN